MTPVLADLVRRTACHLVPDRSRVVTRMFVPGREVFDDQGPRASGVVERLLALDEAEVQRAFDDVVSRFDGRHADLIGTFRRHADELADRVHPTLVLSPTRRLLLGATFTSEYALEGAALCNPSVVADPDQSGVADGGLRFVMSVRAIGEGHVSSIGFRTGAVDADGGVTIDVPSPFTTGGEIDTASLDAVVFRGEIGRRGGLGENADYVLDGLGPRFSVSELEDRLGRLEGRRATRSGVGRTIALMRSIAARSYAVRFPAATPLAERVLMPATSAESNGMEDARFVRFDDGDGAPTYYATYTAYDGTDIAQQLLETTDFCSFRASPIVGPVAVNKGLALFPRRVGGRYAALCRSDRETNRIAFSGDLQRWDEARPCQAPGEAWEMLQLGNCGSPIETEAGWLALTHGVGPMRTYSIGALLLDLDDPTRILGRLREPLLTPGPDEQDGYVPNVVYSCGSLVHAGTLVLPYGVGDAAIRVATVPLAALLDVLLASPEA